MTLILTILGMIPGLAGIAERITGKWFDTKVNILSARLGADKDVVRQALVTAGIEAQAGVNRLQVIASSKILLFIVLGFALPFIVYEWQCIVIDKVWNHGTTSTDPITGSIADWATIILTGIFGTSGAIALSKMYFGNRPNA